MPAPLSWRFQVTGANEVKDALRQVSTATSRTKDTSKQYSQTLKQQASVANDVIGASDMQRKVLLAQHPGLLSMTRAMSNLNTVMSASTSIAQLWNLTQIANNTANNRGAQIASDIARQEALLNDMREQGLEGTREYSEEQEKLNELYSEQAEESKRAFNQQVGGAFSAAAAIGLLVGTFGQIVQRSPRALGAIVAMGVAMKGLSVASIAALGPIALIAGAIAAVAFAIGLVIGFFTGKNPLAEVLRDFWPEAADAIDAFQERWTQGVNMIIRIGEFLGRTLGEVWTGIVRAFEDAGTALRNGMIFVWNGIIGIINAAGAGITAGINSAVNVAVNAINTLISLYNSAARKIGAGTISKIPFSPLSYTPIPTISAAAGFDGVVTKPTMFLAGEGGQSERIRIGQGSGTGSPRVIMINIGGSIVTEREVADKTLRELDRRFRERGW